MSMTSLKNSLQTILLGHPNLEKVLDACESEGFQNVSDFQGVSDATLKALGFRLADIARLRSTQKENSKFLHLIERHGKSMILRGYGKWLADMVHIGTFKNPEEENEFLLHYLKQLIPDHVFASAFMSPEVELFPLESSTIRVRTLWSLARAIETTGHSVQADLSASAVGARVGVDGHFRKFLAFQGIELEKGKYLDEEYVTHQFVVRSTVVKQSFFQDVVPSHEEFYANFGDSKVVKQVWGGRQKLNIEHNSLAHGSDLRKTFGGFLGTLIPSGPVSVGASIGFDHQENAQMLASTGSELSLEESYHGILRTVAEPYSESDISTILFGTSPTVAQVGAARAFHKQFYDTLSNVTQDVLRLIEEVARLERLFLVADYMLEHYSPCNPGNGTPENFVDLVRRFNTWNKTIWRPSLSSRLANPFANPFVTITLPTQGVQDFVQEFRTFSPVIFRTVLAQKLSEKKATLDKGAIHIAKWRQTKVVLQVPLGASLAIVVHVTKNALLKDSTLTASFRLESSSSELVTPSSSNFPDPTSYKGEILVSNELYLNASEIKALCERNGLSANEKGYFQLVLIDFALKITPSQNTSFNEPLDGLEIQFRVNRSLSMPE